jgi:hypothetical protein
MAGAYAIAVEGLRGLEEFDPSTYGIDLAALRAVNKTATKYRTTSARRIREQVKFPARFLTPSAKRLYVSKQATRTDISAVITGRARATSLAQFVVGTPRKGEGVRVEVAPGRARFLKKAFLIKLKSGTANIDTKFNMGLAVRLGPGETLRNKTQSRRISKGLYLLYGPSIDQVFIDNAGRGVAEDLSPEIADSLNDEFLRLLDL